MNIVVLGKGNMGTPLAKLAAQAGHAVRAFNSKENPTEALRDAEIVIIATKYEQALGLVALREIATGLAGKIVVDVTNPLTPDYMGLTVGHTTSAAEEIASRLPGARIVKAFNTIFSALLTKRADGGEVQVPVFVAGDDSDAVETVAAFARATGFDAIASGGLSNARYLEPMAELMIQLGFGLGHGDKIGFDLVKEA